MNKEELYFRLHKEGKPISLSLRHHTKQKIEFVRLLIIPSFNVNKKTSEVTTKGKLYLAYKDGVKTDYAPIGFLKDWKIYNLFKLILKENPILKEELEYVLDGKNYHIHNLIQLKRKNQKKYECEALHIDNYFGGDSFEIEKKDWGKITKEWYDTLQPEMAYHSYDQISYMNTPKTHFKAPLTDDRKKARSTFIEERKARRKAKNTIVEASTRKMKRGSDGWGMPGNPYMKLQLIDTRPRLVEKVPTRSGKQLKTKITILNEEETISSYYIEKGKKIPFTVTRLKKPTYKTIKVLRLPQDMCMQYHKIKEITKNLEEVKS